MTGPGRAPLEWRAWPLKRRPGRGGLAALVLVGSCWGVWTWTGSAVLTVLAAVVLWLSVGPFFVPTRYRLSPEGVEVARPGRRRIRPWTDFRSVRHGGDLIVLSPSRGGSWLDALRGETLRLEGNREEVLDYVREMVGKTEGAGPA